MKLLSHKIKDFRNIKELSLDFNGDIAVITGLNGQGKTNLLESIWLLTGGRSFRTNSDLPLVRKGAPFSVVESVFFAKGREQTARLTLSPQGRQISVNKGSPVRPAAFVGEFNCVVFAPDSIETVKGPAAERRRFLDTAICQLYPSYLSAARSYSRQIMQKNALLKDCRTVSAAFDMLDAFDEAIARTATAITRARSEFCARLLPAATALYNTLSDGGEELDISYQSTLFDAEPDEAEAFAALIRARSNDMRAGFSTAGPHRDELVLTLSGNDARAYSSQGQKRSVMLALKLAEARLFCETAEERPLLLLDDVLSELDERRQSFLIDCIKDGQAIVTGCDAHVIEGKADCSIYKISDGAVV